MKTAKDEAFHVEGLIKTEATALMRSWYLHPDFSALGLYHGVHLGECAEYVCFLDLVRIMKSKLILNPLLASGVHSLQKNEPLSLREARLNRLPASKRRGNNTRTDGKAPQKPSALVCVRPQNMVMVKAMWETGAFELVIEGNEEAISDPLQQADIQYEPFSAFMTSEVRSTCETRFAERLALWEKALESSSFRAQFSFQGIDLFSDVKDCLRALFSDQFFQEMLYIETLNRLVQKRRVALILVWNDSLPPHRALTLSGQRLSVPILHVSHAIHSMTPTNEVVYADRIAVYGDFSRKQYIGAGNPPEKVITTGNPDWDKYTFLPRKLDRGEICRSLGLDPGKRTVLFATFFVSYPLGSVDPSSPEKLFRSLVRAVRDLQPHRQIQLAVKLHPAEEKRRPWYQRMASEEGMEELLIESESLEELLFVSDLVICRGSNIGFEALLLGKPVISYQANLFGDDRVVTVIHDVAELTAAIERALTGGAIHKDLDRIRKEVIRRYNSVSDGKATQRVMNIIREMTGIPVRLPSGFIPLTSSLTQPTRRPVRSGARRLDLLLEEGDLAESKGDLEKAVRAYEEIETRDPRSAEALRRLGRVFMKSGRLDAAIEKLKGLLTLQAGCVEGHLLIALALYQQNKYDMALSHLGTVRDLGSTTEQEKKLALLYTARCQKAVGSLEEAENSYEQSLLLDPDCIGTLKELGNLCFEMGQLDRSKSILQQVMERDPQDTEVLNDMGVVLVRMGRPEEGRSCLQKALEMAPAYFDALQNLVELERQEGNYDAALSLLQDFLSIHPENQAVWSLQRSITAESRKTGY
jgi:tetratricopeptide (TPR) repeat protein